MPRLVPLVLLPLLACAGPDDPGTPRHPRDTDEPGDSDGTGESGDTAGTTDTGGPPTCGDNVHDALGEECDGADDGDCPGRCSVACQCPSLPASGELQLHVLDVDQGDGLLVISPDGFTMLVDAGDEDTHLALERRLLAVGATGLDFTLVSHQHADQMGAMDLVLTEHPEVGIARDGGGTADTSAYDEYVLAAGHRRRAVLAGDTLDLGPASAVDVLHSDIGDGGNENNNSVVVRLTYGGVRMLLGGDCEAEVCEAAFDPGPIDIYKVHHHGSSDSTSQRIVARMAPSLALISVGLDNDYGLPDESTLSRLSAAGAEIRRTDEEGNIVVVTDGEGWDVSSDAEP